MIFYTILPVFQDWREFANRERLFRLQVSKKVREIDDDQKNKINSAGATTMCEDGTNAFLLL